MLADTLPISPKQADSIRNSTGRVNIWEGAIRSSKTIASLLRWLIFISTAPHGGQLVVIARTRDTAYRNVFAPLMDEALFGFAARFVSYTAGAPTARILGRTVFVIGASDAKAEKVLRGLTVAGAYVDEVTVIPEEFFTQLLGRMSVTGAQLFGTTNPDNPAHWLKRKFLDRLEKLPDWRSFHFHLTDNPSLTAEYIESVSREFTGLWYRRFILGEWVAAEGAIYDMWDPARHVVPWTSLPRMERILGVGVDYGTTNATAALTLGIAPHWVNDTYHGHRLYLLDEWRYDARVEQIRKTNAELSAAMRAWMGGQHTPYKDEPRPEWVFIDPAAASFRVQLEADGVPNVASADNSVSYGIGTVASLLGGHLFTTDRTPGWNQEAPGYSWDEKATQAGEDKPIKVADHSLDAGRYVITTTESVWREYIH
ncbi:PBSX family phage terminase large subunit [Humibacter sp.]|uniref:PBSX family phage terminase large subunit n=1 Tax=Humibacter sp. TaxID=1940291 RepID=UPI003F7E552D